MSEPSPIMLSTPDAGNRSAGQALRVAREAHGLTLEGLAATIKVTPAKLAALEDGRYELLPDAAFTRALAMTVCRALKLDPASVLAALPAAIPVSLATGKPPLNQPFKESRGGSPLFDKHMNWASLLSFKWLAPAALLLGAVVIYSLPDSVQLPAWVQHLNQPAAPADAASAVQPGDAASAAELPVPDASVATAQPPAPLVAASAVAPGASSTLTLDAADAGASAAAVAPASALPIATVAPASQVAAPAASSAAGASPLHLSVFESSWVEIRDAGGRKVLSRHVQGGEELNLEGEAPMTVRIGNASGVQMSYKGRAVDMMPFTRNNVARLELK